MSEHAFGPFWVEERPNYQGRPDLTGGWIVSRDVLVAEIAGAIRIDGRVHPQNMANACLLATAPQMLAELKFCFMGAGNLERMAHIIAQAQGAPIPRGRMTREAALAEAQVTGLPVRCIGWAATYVLRRDGVQFVLCDGRRPLLVYDPSDPRHDCDKGRTWEVAPDPIGVAGRPETVTDATLAIATLSALEGLLAVRPSNWDDDEDPEQKAAWEAADRAIAMTRKARP